MHFSNGDLGRLERWLRRIPAGQALALVMGSSANGLSYSRSLGRRGIPLLLLGSDRSAGVHTRYGNSYILPRVDESPGEWLSALEFIGSRVAEPAVVFVTSDLHLLFLSRNRKEIGQHFRYLIPDAQTVENIINKRMQYAIAEKAGIAVPKTFYPETVADARSWALDMPYPCILKPYSISDRKQLQKKAFAVHSPAELIDRFAGVSRTGGRFMIQDIIPGPRESMFAYHGFIDGGGLEKAWWTKQHLRGMAFGDGSYHITVDAPEVASLSRRLLSAFDYRGFSHVEFKLDPRDQTYRLMEINPRTGLSNQQGIAAGIDLPWLGYRYLTGMGSAEEDCPPFKRGVTYVNEEIDLRAFLDLRRSGNMGFLSWLRSLLSADTKAIWAWDDPLPFLSLVVKLGKTYLINKFVKSAPQRDARSRPVTG